MLIFECRTSACCIAVIACKPRVNFDSSSGRILMHTALYTRASDVLNQPFRTLKFRLKIILLNVLAASTSYLYSRITLTFKPLPLNVFKLQSFIQHLILARWNARTEPLSNSASVAIHHSQSRQLITTWVGDI